MCGKPERCRAVHDKLLHFIAVSPWSDRDIRRFAADYALLELAKREPIEDWIIDDTGFPKQGTKSPGVQLQYSGPLGKTGNCQLAVSVTVATGTMHLPIDMDLYLPESWAKDRKRCRAAHIPLCQRRVRQLLLETYVLMGGKRIDEHAPTIPKTRLVSDASTTCATTTGSLVGRTAGDRREALAPRVQRGR